MIYGRDGRDEGSRWEGCVCYKHSVMEGMDWMDGRDGCDG